MAYQAISMTERMRRVRERYLTMTVPAMKDPYHPTRYRSYRSGDRLMTLGYLRGFAAHADAPTTRLRTSYAEAQELYEAKPVFCDDELLLGHLYLPEYTEEEQEEYDRLCESFDLSAHTLRAQPPRKDHICLDFEKLLRVGVKGLREEIRTRQAAIDQDAPKIYPDMEAIKQWEFYECCP